MYLILLVPFYFPTILWVVLFLVTLIGLKWFGFVPISVVLGVPLVWYAVEYSSAAWESYRAAHKIHQLSPGRCLEEVPDFLVVEAGHFWNQRSADSTFSGISGVRTIVYSKVRRKRQERARLYRELQGSKRNHSPFLFPHLDVGARSYLLLQMGFQSPVLDPTKAPSMLSGPRSLAVVRGGTARLLYAEGHHLIQKPMFPPIVTLAGLVPIRQNVLTSRSAPVIRSANRGFLERALKAISCGRS